VFGHYTNKSKFIARRNHSQIKGLNSTLAFGPESFVFPFFFLVSKNTKSKIHRTIIFRVDVYVCEIWSLTLRVERKLRVVSDNRVLRKIFGTKRKIT
jgi:hypothetical protein